MRFFALPELTNGLLAARASRQGAHVGLDAEIVLSDGRGRVPFLGTRILRVYGRKRGRSHSGIYSPARRRGQAPGSNGALVTGHRKVAPEDGAALATPNSRFERLTS